MFPIGVLINGAQVFFSPDAFHTAVEPLRVNMPAQLFTCQPQGGKLRDPPH